MSRNQKNVDDSNRESDTDYGEEVSIEEISEIDSDQGQSESAHKTISSKKVKPKADSEEREVDFACVPASNMNKDTTTFNKLSEVSNRQNENYDSQRGSEAVRSMVMAAGSQLLKRGT